jgi:hypothetical protein
MRDDEGRQVRPAQATPAHEGRTVETATEARAGFLDRPVLVVLCVSLVLAVVILGAVWLGYFSHGA